MTDDNSFLRQTLKKNLRITPKNLEESGNILEKTYGLGPTQRYTIERFLKREIAPVELNGLNEVTTSKELELMQSGNTNLQRYL